MLLLVLDSCASADSDQSKLTSWLISKGVNNCLDAFEILMSIRQQGVESKITYFLHPAEDLEHTYRKPLSRDVNNHSQIFNVYKGSRQSEFYFKFLS